MFRIHTEVPSGAQSRGYQYEDATKANENLARIADQLDGMDFDGELIMTEDGVEVFRGRFRAKG